MTRGSIKIAAQRHLGDIGATYYDAEDINGSIQDAYNCLATETECIKRFTNFTIPANVNYVNLYESIPNYLSTLAVYDVDNKRFLFDYTSWPLGFRNLGQNWEATFGTQINWAPVDLQQIVFYPRQTVSKNVIIFYSATPNLLELSEYEDKDLTELDLPADFEDLLVKYVRADMLESGFEFKKALKLWKEFDAEFTHFEERIKNFNNADLLRMI